MNKNRWILFIGLGIGLLGLLLPLALFLTDISGTSLKDIPLPDLMPIPIVLVTLIIIGLAMIPFLRILFPPVIKNGVTAEARVVEVHDTGVTINNNPQIRLLLEVHPSLSPVFMSEVKTVVSRLQVGQVMPGTRVQVLYDPNNLRRIVVKSIEPASASQGEAQARLEELEHLREKGLITPEEYQRKREEIIKRI